MKEALLFSLYHKHHSKGEFISFLHFALTTLYKHITNPKFDIVVFLKSDDNNFSFDFDHLNQFNLIKDFPNVRFIYSDYESEDAHMAKWYHFEKTFDLGYEKVLYFDCDVIFFKDPSYFFKKYNNEYFWCLREVESPVNNLILKSLGINSGHFLMHKKLFYKIPNFYKTVSQKRKKITEEASILLDQEKITKKQFTDFSFFNEQYGTQLVLEDFGINIDSFDHKEIFWGYGYTKTKRRKNGKIKYYNNPNTVWHYTAASAHLAIPFKYFTSYLQERFDFNSRVELL